MHKIIYNYKLIRRFRKSWFWYIGYVILMLSVFSLPIKQLNQDLMTSTIFIVGSLYLSYLFWNILGLRRIRVSIKLNFPTIPWFGLIPRQLISVQQFKQYELMVFNLFSVTFIWILFFIPEGFYLFFLSLYLVLISYRFWMFIQIVFVQQSTDYIKYEPFGLSIYQTEFKNNDSSINLEQ